MKLCIPSIGDEFELTQTWEFPLHYERRNDGLIKRIKGEEQRSVYGNNSTILAIIPKGSVLKVARIYIRAGKSEWDSITFTIKSSPGDAKLPKEQKLAKARFWAKLDDVNEIRCKKLEDDPA